MYSKIQKMNSRGFTLIEIIASITILGMVIAVFLPIFPQIMTWSKHTDDTLVASNLLARVASETKEINVVDFFDNHIKSCANNMQEDHVFFKEYYLNEINYTATLNVCIEADVNLYRANIKILSPDGRLISESYTYIGDSNE